MKKLMEQMAEELSAAFEKSGYDPSYGKVTVSNRPDLCEFQCNGAMAGAKAYKKSFMRDLRMMRLFLLHSRGRQMYADSGIHYWKSMMK